MSNTRRGYSYSGRKNKSHKLRLIILGAVLFVLLYSSLAAFFFSVVVLENSSMERNLRVGERFIFSSYNFYSLIPGLDMVKEPSFRRGSVVLVEMFREEKPGPVISILDGVVRLFTFHRFHLLDHSDHLFVKRVIGLPGDEISMTNFVVRVRARDNPYSLTEFEVSERDYTPDIPRLPALWDSQLPFSGNMDSIVLGENECFVLSDDRSNTNDSRTWGPVPLRNITGRALFRYWPLNRLGRV